ncbi:MAG: cytochrome c biogenesis CcdA family protein [Pseudomonadota bacterium]
MELIFAYGAGLLTLINPCVLPILPIVLAGALQASRIGPVAMAAGLGVSFVALGMVVLVAGRAIGLSAEMVAQAGAVLMIGFGAIMLVPQLSERFAFATAGVSSSADASITSLDSGGWRGQFMAGLLLGAVWSPCVGPTLGGAISMASQGENLLRAGGIMVAFAFGIGTVVIALGYGASAILRRNQTRMIKFAAAAKPALGAVFILVGTALLLQWHHRVESWLLDIMPYWLQDLSVAL